jgi:hypothetical protein
MSIGLTALLVLSALFAYGQETDSSIFKQTTFVPGSPQTGAENVDPIIIYILQYGINREKHTFSVGEPLNVGVKNATGERIWYIRRTPPGVGAGLLEKESIRIQRLVNNKWFEAKDQYTAVLDDPDGQFAPKRHRIDADVTVIRKWTPHEPGQYRVLFIYYIDPTDNTEVGKAYSQPFTVKPKAITPKEKTQSQSPQ